MSRYTEVHRQVPDKDSYAQIPLKYTAHANAVCLQDISDTLALLYDALNEDETPEEREQKKEPMGQSEFLDFLLDSHPDCTVKIEINGASYMYTVGWVHEHLTFDPNTLKSWVNIHTYGSTWNAYRIE